MKKALIQLHVAVFLAGFTAILGKLIGLNEALLVWYRLLITVISLGLLLFFSRQLKKVTGRELWKMFGVGTVIAIHWVTFYGSVKYSNVSIALVCFSATGFFTAIFEPLLLRRRASLIELGLGLIAIAGISLIFSFNPEYKTGILFGLFSAIGSAIFPVFNKQLLEKHSPRTLTFYELGGGLIVLGLLIPFYLYYFPASYYLPTATDWGWLIVLAWACTIWAFDLLMKALKKISAFTANLSYNLEPVYGILLAFVIFKENKDFGAAFYKGVGLILLAVVLQMVRVYWVSRKERV